MSAGTSPDHGQGFIAISPHPTDFCSRDLPYYTGPALLGSFLVLCRGTGSHTEVYLISERPGKAYGLPGGSLRVPGLVRDLKPEPDEPRDLDPTTGLAREIGEELGIALPECGYIGFSSTSGDGGDGFYGAHVYLAVPGTAPPSILPKGVRGYWAPADHLGCSSTTSLYVLRIMRHFYNGFRRCTGGGCHLGDPPEEAATCESELCRVGRHADGSVYLNFTTTTFNSRAWGSHPPCGVFAKSNGQLVADDEGLGEFTTLSAFSNEHHVGAHFIFCPKACATGGSKGFKIIGI